MPEQNQEQTVNPKAAPATQQSSIVSAVYTIARYIKRLENRIAILEQKLGIDTSVQTQNSEASEAKNYLYFAGVAAGMFSKPSQELGENSLYRFDVDKDKARVYVIENNPSVAQKFSNNTDSHETACIFINQCPENFSGIKTVEPGEADLIDSNNNKWKIRTKIKVEYLG